MMRRIVGNYLLGEPIGSGAAAEVYEARHRFLDDPVAIKLLSADASVSDDAVDHLVAEASRARAISHPHVVRVIDVGRDARTGRAYLVMERVNGDDLATRLRDDGVLDEPRARRLGAAIADGMQAAHDQGVVHRDLKPANVMMDGDDPKIVDFGIAKHLGTRSADRTARRVGTPAYMAPEQLAGGLVTPWVDVWALGVMLFEMVTGRLPFSGFDDGRCPQLFESAPRVGEHARVSPAFEALVARCLEREPGRRPASMREIGAALRGELETHEQRLTDDLGPAPDAPVAPGSSRPRVRSPRTAWPWLGGAGAIVVVGTILVARACAAPEGDAELAATSLASDASPATGAVDASRTPGAGPADAGPSEVVLTSRPEGAHVFRNGALIGVTPARLAISLPADLTLRKPGYRDARVRVEREGRRDVRLGRRERRPRPPPTGETLD